MKKSFSICLLLLLFFISCKHLHHEENLFTTKTYLEDSIVYDVPKSPRLCDGMNVEKLYVNIGDCKLYCEVEGEGIPLVLIHGGPGGTHHCFHPWLSGAKERFRIVYYDQRGCGLSDYKAGEGYSFLQAANDLEKLRKSLKIDKWIVLGHSFGGGLAQLYTLKYPEKVLGQILVGSVPMINSPELVSRRTNPFLDSTEIKKLDEILKLLIAGKLTYEQYFYNDDINGGWKRQNFLKPTPERQAQLASYDIVFDTAYNSDYMKYSFEHSFDTSAVPTLICEGKYDSLWFSKKVPALVKNHPKAQFRLFEKSSHNIYRDEPELFIKTIANWVDSLKTTDH